MPTEGLIVALMDAVRYWDFYVLHWGHPMNVLLTNWEFFGIVGHLASDPINLAILFGSVFWASCSVPCRD
jgi:hypothetical protein